MEDMNELQLTCFEIISYVGTAKSCFVNAMTKAREGNFEEAANLIAEGDKAFAEGHDVHLKLLQADAAGEREPDAPSSSCMLRIRWQAPRPCASWPLSSSLSTSAWMA